VTWLVVGLGTLAVVAGVLWIVMWPPPARWDRVTASVAERKAQGYRVNVPMEQFVWLRGTRLRATIWGLAQIAFGIYLLSIARRV
jgi:hypothetical protein